MRIVGGTLSGRKILPPTSLTTRPMMDRVRQALFNILEHHEWGKAIGNIFYKTTVLDAFCGTGALAFEAISRGALHGYLFDKDREALLIANKNARALNIHTLCSITETDATGPRKASDPCRLVFLAPPYRKNLVLPSLTALDHAGWIAPHAVVVIETAKKEALELSPAFEHLFSRYYGETALHFARR